MASDYKVPLTKILDIENHPNAHSLEIATVYGFQVIIGKDLYKVGDEIVYIPIDSVLPINIESRLFPPESKIKLDKGRVRQIRIRGLASQGMVVNKSDLEHLVNFSKIQLEEDLSEQLKITKYEPPAKGPAQTQGKPGSRKQLAHPDFHSYNGLDNIKWFPNFFKEGDLVVIQEKLHGTNARAGKVPYRANTLFKKIKKFFGLAPEFENVYGSNKVDISNSSSYNGYYGTDVYGAFFSELKVFDMIKPNEIIYGEIVGPGIQKGYSYGLTKHKFVLFDVKIILPDGSQKWLNPDEVEEYAFDRGFDFVPILYRGAFNKDLAYSLTFGKSKFNDESEKVREGIVIKDAVNYSNEGNKRALKWISEDYLNDKSNTDEH